MAQDGPHSQTIAVIGGGIAGVTAALEAAETGYDVILIEKEPALGGRVTAGLELPAFVTLYQGGNLRGCIGGLEPRWPLAEDVRVHAVAAALQDPRFPPVTPQELPDIEIEVSVLSPLQPLNYRTPEDLIRHLRPGVDGVLLEDPESGARATFLPQVWEKLPDPRAFLSHLALKAGLPPDAWLHRPLRIWTYQVEEFREGHPSGSP